MMCADISQFLQTGGEASSQYSAAYVVAANHVTEIGMP